MDEQASMVAVLEDSVERVNPSYRIARCAPKRTVIVGEQLLPVIPSVLFPTYDREQRFGSKRERRIVRSPVLPGFLFIPERNADDAAALLNAQGRRVIGWMKNKILGAVTPYCTCKAKDIEPLFGYVEPNDSPYVFSEGELVTINSSIFNYVLANVVRVKKGQCVVLPVNSRVLITLPSSLLLPGKL